MSYMLLSILTRLAYMDRAFPWCSTLALLVHIYRYLTVDMSVGGYMHEAIHSSCTKYIAIYSMNRRYRYIDHCVVGCMHGVYGYRI